MVLLLGSDMSSCFLAESLFMSIWCQVQVIICSQSEDWIAAKLSDVHPSCYPLFSMAWLPSSNGRLTYMPWTTNKLASEDDVFCNLLLSSSHGVGTLLSLGDFNMKNFPIMPSMDNWTSDIARYPRCTWITALLYACFCCCSLRGSRAAFTPICEWWAKLSILKLNSFLVGVLLY